VLTSRSSPARSVRRARCSCPSWLTSPADQDDALGQQRIHELATAMEALGVRDHRFLGGPGHYRDSGMMGLDTNERPGCFWQADVDVAADLLVESSARYARRSSSPTTRTAATATPTTSSPPGDDALPSSERPTRRSAAASSGTSRRSTGTRCRSRGCVTGSAGCVMPGDTTRSRGWIRR
jgi:hypothetical protein